MRVLVVEDDSEVAQTVEMAFTLRWPGCEVDIQDTAAGAVEAVRTEGYDLVVLDVQLPDDNGFSVLETIRRSSDVRVIMLTVRGSEVDRVRGLEKGADDYLSKPFSPLELLARASAVLRRSATGSASEDPVMKVLQAGPISLNQDTAEVFVDEHRVSLSPTEFKILTLLMENAGRVVSRDALIKDVWGIDPGAGDSYLVKLHIQHLRRKLGDDRTQPKYVVTVRGFGYKVPA